MKNGLGRFGCRRGAGSRAGFLTLATLGCLALLGPAAGCNDMRRIPRSRGAATSDDANERSLAWVVENVVSLNEIEDSPTLEPIRDTLYSNTQSENSGLDNRWMHMLSRQVQHAEVELTAILARSTVRLSDVLKALGNAMNSSLSALLDSGVSLLALQPRTALAADGEPFEGGGLGLDRASPARLPARRRMRL